MRSETSIIRLVAAISAFVLGGLWYGPLFGNGWKTASGVKPEDTRQGPRREGLRHLVRMGSARRLRLRDVSRSRAGVRIGGRGRVRGRLFWIAGSFAINYQFEQRPTRLLLINGGYHTAQYTLYGVILGLWH